MRPEKLCGVWWARLAELRAAHLELLDTDERRRRAGFARAADRDRFTLGAALLRLAAGAHLGIPARRVPVRRRCPHCRGPHGRPTLPGEPLHLSVTHAGDLVGVAVTAAGPVGLDVEQEVELDWRRLARRIQAPGEADPIRSRAGFLRCWTRKESVLKATGDGLRVPMSEVAIGPGPTLLRYRSRVRPPAHLTDLPAPPGYAAALTVLAPAPPRVTAEAAGGLLIDRAICEKTRVREGRRMVTGHPAGGG
ncbi:4'-phosphopantetheinyl transferase family protein [Micromonospora chaiyaphumensis]|nr:4'-phosphopantetheinyl transferase superfamily protein [Micromonospora chaiyaphumensis]